MRRGAEAAKSASLAGGLRGVLLAVIRGYQLLISPLLGPRCRFYPSCSHYTHQALSRHGLRRGMVLGVARIVRCHPWHAGGVDLVPELEQPACEGAHASRRSSAEPGISHKAIRA